ncbi:MAG: ATP-binding protein [Spirochaetales bacterium]|nr:ATP-binding protein [Spirochaetales bacterium]
MDLIDWVNQHKVAEKRNYLFIDEVQEIEGFEKALRSLLASGEVDIYCTGSNAKMLSSEIATLLAGRSMEFTIYSLSYPEFLEFHSIEDSDSALEKFIKFGGLPYLIHLDLEDDIVFEYLKNIYYSILYRDILSRYQLRNVQFIERLVLFLADNTGSLVSAKSISDFLKSQRTHISPQVVLIYLGYLEDAFFIFPVSRYDIGGKGIFEIGEKYYFEDLGLRHSLSGFRQGHINKVIENLIYLHLRFLGYTVYVGHLKQWEIDFVAEKNNSRVYIQASYLISDESTREREIGNLLKIEDHFPKFLVSIDPIVTSEKGIEHLKLRDFLSIESL